MNGPDERPLFQLRVCDLEEKFAQLEMRVAELMSPAAPALLTRAGLAKALSCSEKHIDRLRRDGLPELPLGDAPRFELTEVLRWLRGRGATPGPKLVDAGK